MSEKVYILHIENGNMTEVEVYSSLALAKAAPRLAAFDVEANAAWGEQEEGPNGPVWYLDSGFTASIYEYIVDEFK